jgi:hypothetical protein
LSGNDVEFSKSTHCRASAETKPLISGAFFISGLVWTCEKKQPQAADSDGTQGGIDLTSLGFDQQCHPTILGVMMVLKWLKWLILK